MKNENKVLRTRNFATVVYEDSAPDNWRELLAEQFIPAFISPYHDKDINPDNTPKKPHWHIMLMFEGPKTVEQARAVFGLINGVGCEILNSVRGYARYLCHLDNPEKAQYDTEKVVSLCGAEYSSIIGLATDKYKAIREMMHFCSVNRITAYCNLIEYASLYRMDWFRILCDCGTVVMKEYLSSAHWREHSKDYADNLPVNWLDNDIADINKIKKDG